jgi:amidohydrolase
VSRNIDPLAAAVVTVGTINAGTAFNIIPPRAEITGTTRALSAAVRDQIESRVRAVAEGTATTFGASAEVEYIRGNPPLVNEIRMSDLLTRAAEDVVGAEQVRPMPPMMGGEDFAYYCEKMPSAFAFVGARNPAIGTVYPHHHPMFAIDESALTIGARLFLKCVDLWAEGSSIGKPSR